MDCLGYHPKGLDDREEEEEDVTTGGPYASDRAKSNEWHPYGTKTVSKLE